MAEEFQAGICGGSWWNPSRSVMFSAAAAAAVASPCSMGLNHEVAGFGWPSLNSTIDENKARSNSSGDTNNSVCESPNMAYQEVIQKPHHHHTQTDHSGSLLIDSTLQFMGFDLSPTHNSNNLVRNTGRSESANMYSILQEDMGLTKLTNNYHQIQSSSGFPVNSASYGYNSVALLQSFFDDETNQSLPQQQSFSNGTRSENYSSNYNTSIGTTNVNTNMLSSSWPRNTISSPPSNNKQFSQPAASGGLQFSNNTQFWNASEAVIANESINIRSSLTNNNNYLSQPHQQYATPTFEQKPKCNNLSATKSMVSTTQDQGHRDSGSSCVVKKTSNGNEQPVVKRARIETPSPLPTFKVRKEKLGDRITALQQLVSPFGKTDTASVLHEAIDYIKFLHDQVSVLSTPYMKNGASVQVHHQGSNKIKTQQETSKQDLKSRGLCLVPISSTFPVANETTADFWPPNYGGNFR